MDFIDNIPLTAKETSSITQYKTFGDAWVKRALRGVKAKKYIEEHLALVSDSAHSCGSCCNNGTLVFARKDGGVVTDDDIKALLIIDRGQENRVQKREALTVTIYWLCDSSD